MKLMRAAGLLLLILIFSGFCDRVHAKSLLKVAMLDIGQGDSIYIEAPNGNQMIVDGGPAGSLMAPLSQVMPFGDRSIDVLMVTNPDADHYAGFIDLLEHYDAGSVVEPGTHSSTKTYARFENAVSEKQIPEVLARRGMTIALDPEDGVLFTVLFPDRDVSSWTTNDGSIVGILSYGTTKVMFTGDATKKTESIILSESNAAMLKSDILKVGHHGSRTSSSDAFVAAVAPLYAMISDAQGNTYGHPHKETLDTLERHGITTARTDKEGTIIFVSDGLHFMRQ
jgi:competence protein ComEC